MNSAVHVQFLNNPFERAILLVDKDLDGSSVETNYASETGYEEVGMPMEFSAASDSDEESLPQNLQDFSEQNA